MTHYKLLYSIHFCLAGLALHSGMFLIKLNLLWIKIHYMLTANWLLPNITYSTRITRTSATLIDNIYSNSFEEVVNSGIISNKSISDHQLIFSCFDSIINLKFQSIAPNIKKNVNYEALNIEIKNTSYCNLKTNIHDDPSNKYNIFEDKLTKVI